MPDAVLDVETSLDGSLVVHLRGALGVDQAVELRRTLVHAVRRRRPMRLILDLQDVTHLDPINLGTLAAACGLGDDHAVAVFLDGPPPVIAAELRAAGVAAHRIRPLQAILTSVTSGSAAAG